jgi:hypothetical protein
LGYQEAFGQVEPGQTDPWPTRNVYCLAISLERLEELIELRLEQAGLGTRYDGCYLSCLQIDQWAS